MAVDKAPARTGGLWQILKRSFFLAATALATPLSADAAEITLLPLPAEQDVVRENGRLAIPQGARIKTLDLAPAGGFKAGQFYECRIRYENCRFTFLTGRTYEVPEKQKDGTRSARTEAERILFTPVRDKQNNRWYGLRADEWSAQSTDRRSRSSSVSLNYSMPEQTFATIDNVARWQEREAEMLKRDLLKEDVRLGVAIANSGVQFFVNGVYLCRLPHAGGDLTHGVLRVEKNTTLSDTARVTDLDPRFYPVDLSERLNAAGFSAGGKLKNLPAGTEIAVNGVPFRLAENPRYDNVDLSMSWMETALRAGYLPTAPSVRWRAGREKVPLRYQFSIPSDDYDALYVLAASDGKPDTIPRFTAQFYLRGQTHEGGRPIGFASPEVPAFTAAANAASAYPVTSGTGKPGNLHLVKVKLEPGQFRRFSESASLEMELTKDVQPYRSYPDPIHHSIHGAGLPSSVRVFGLTLAKSPLKATFDPDALGNVWLDGEKASYTVKLENVTKASRRTQLSFAATSYDRGETFTDQKTVSVGPGETKAVRFAFTPKRFGHFDVTLVKEDAGEQTRFARTLAHLRRRDHKPRGFFDKGMFYGSWLVYGAADAKLAAMMGLDSFDWLLPADEKARETMAHYGMKGFMDGHTLRVHSAIKADKTDEDNMAALLKALPDCFRTPSAIHEPVFSAVLCEPGGIGTGHAGFGEYYGEAPYDYSQLAGREKERYALYKKLFLIVRKGILQVRPNTKIMLPNGSWTFAIPFLQDPETRELFDGVKMDYQYYQRLPEQQMHQCSIHSMFYFWNSWRRYRKALPVLSLGEGPGISQVYPGANDEETAAALQIRAALLMAGYGVQHQHAVAYRLMDSGENHCSGGFLDNEVTLNPHLSYSTFAAFSRHTRHAVFESYTNPGSLSAYCANFRDSRSGRLLRIIWSIRGTREFIIDAAPGELEVYDPLDNLVTPEMRADKSVVKVGQIPVYVYGTAEKTSVTLGAIDHRDSKPGPFVKRLGNAADLFTEQTADEDRPYVEFHPSEIKRFHANMDIAAVTVDERYGSKALSVTLPKQEVDRNLMPYYTCLKPEKPVPISGKAAHILLWANANSDWGRVVYVLRDARGKLWYSVGFAGNWNCDDMPGDSVFCFDSWRLLRYELPANAPWDSFRELGMTRWGSDREDSIVELPLALEKIFIERRSSVMYGNGAHRIAEEKPVLLGDLYVEYAKESDMTDEAIRLSRIRAPQFPAASLPNPIAELRKSGALPPGRIAKVDDPATWFDGTRGVFTFEMPTNAVGADIWLSLHPDGRGALKLGQGLKKSPSEVSGFLADTEFHAFLVWTDKDGRTSAPSAPFAFKLIDHFQHQ
jgi:hypothetical protein